MDTSLWILWKDIPKISVSHSVVSDSLRPHGLQPTRLLCPWNSSGKNTGVGSHSLLQGIFPTQGLSPDFPHCRQILYQLSYKEITINIISEIKSRLVIWARPNVLKYKNCFSLDLLNCNQDWWLPSHFLYAPVHWSCPWEKNFTENSNIPVWFMDSFVQ